MLQPSICPVRSAQAAELEALTSQYTGKIEVLPGPVFTARPERINPPPRPKKAPRIVNPDSPHEARRQYWTPIILDLFDKGKTIAEIVRETKQGDTFIAARIRWSGRDQAANKRPPPSPALIEKVGQMAAERYSIRYTAQILDISTGLVKTIARQNGFTFNAPTSRKRE